MKILLFAALLTAAPAFAAPDGAIRPLARGEAVTTEAAPLRPKARPSARATDARPAVLTPVVATSGRIRPKLRPQEVAALAESLRISRRYGAASAPESDDLAANTPGVEVVALDVRSLRPTTRPKAIVQKAMARKRDEQRGRAGGLSGIQGEAVGNVPGKGRCGIKNALRVTSVSGVKLSTPALMDRATAKALKRWVDKGLKPAVGNMGGGVASMRVVAHYACRTRNSQPGAKLSEHSFGRAIDLAGFGLRNGDTISVLNHWGGGAKGRALRKMHKRACGPFGTVLGPNANRFHRDHFHFDTARYRSGSYCR